LQLSLSKRLVLLAVVGIVVGDSAAMRVV